MEDETEMLSTGGEPSNKTTIIGKNGNVLIPFQPGQSGNPGGMKKGTRHLSTILRQLLNEEITVVLNGNTMRITRADALMLEKIRLATSSEHDYVRLAAIKDIEDRLEGKPMTTLPPPPDMGEGGVIFYIPNQHSRKREKP